jgi:hypothetical protein
MNPYIFIIASIIIAIITILAYQTTHVNIVYEQEPMKPKCGIHHKQIIRNQNMQYRDRCAPSEMIYENGYVKNKGFVNETIYKPKMDDSQLLFETKLIENSVPLNDNACILSSDLPLGNIHVNYLINKNTSKLSL